MKGKVYLALVLAVLGVATSLGLWKARGAEPTPKPIAVEEVDRSEVTQYDTEINRLIVQRNAFLLYLSKRYGVDPAKYNYDSVKGEFVLKPAMEAENASLK